MANNYSYYAIPAAWALHMSCHWYAISITSTCPEMKLFDNRSPRSFLTKVMASEKQSPQVQRFIRAEAANANGVEQLPILGLAVIAGNLARLPAETMNKFVLTWLGLRALYNVLYIGTNHKHLHGLRSLSYVGAIMSCFNIFIKAGRVLNGQLA